MKNNKISSKSSGIAYCTHANILTSLANKRVSTKIFTIKYNHKDFVLDSS